MTKYCKDCKYCSGGSIIPLPSCTHPSNGVDMVSGNPRLVYCYVKRIYLCGRDAKLFELKEQKVTLWQRVKQMMTS